MAESCFFWVIDLCRIELCIILKLFTLSRVGMYNKEYFHISLNIIIIITESIINIIWLYYVMWCYCMLCYAMLCYAMLCYAMLCYAMLCSAMTWHAMLGNDMLCYVMLCYELLCYVKLCYTMLYFYRRLRLIQTE